MTVSAQPTIFQYVGNGVTTVFAYNCQVLQSSDLNVYVNGVAVTSGITKGGIGSLTGGTVTFTTAPANGAQVILEREVVLERTTDYQQNGDFLSRVVNPDFNRIWMALQQLLTGINRSLKFPKTDVAPITELPPAATRANNLLGFDASGNPITVAPAAQSATALQILLAGLTGSSLIGFIQSGVGAVLRTVQDRLRDTKTAFDYMTVAQIADVKAGTALIDVTAAVKTALAAGATIQAGTYLLTDGVTISSDVRFEGWPKFKFVLGAVAPTTLVEALVYVTAETDISGLRIDAAGSTKAQYGIFVDASTRASTRETKYEFDIRSISNTDSTKACAGFIFYTSSGATNLALKATIKGFVNGVVATANGVVGDSGGSGTGIGVSINKSGTNHDITIIDSSAYGVRPAEDGDGIHIYVVDHTSDTAKGKYRIINCKAGDNAKRCIKVQAQNCVVLNPYTDGDLSDGVTSSSVCIDVYGQDVVVQNPTVKSSFAGDGIAIRGDRNKLVNPIMRMLQPVVPIRVDSSIGFEIVGGSVYTEKNFANNDNPIISVNAGSSGYIRAPKCTNTLSKGSVIQLQSLAAADFVEIDIPDYCAAETLVAARLCTAPVVVNTARGACAGYVIDHSDCADFRIRSLDATTTFSVGVQSLRSTLTMMGSGKISGFTGVGVNVSGVAVGTGKNKITGEWEIIGNGATSGVDLTGSLNSECTGVYTEGATVHIRYSFSTNCIVGNNRGRGAGTHTLGTSATTPVLYNNNIIP